MNAKAAALAILAAVASSLATAAYLRAPANAQISERSERPMGVHDLQDAETFVELHMPGERIRILGDRQSALNKQLVGGLRNRKVIKNPMKWMTAGDFACIDDDGKTITGSLFHPLGKIEIAGKYFDIEFDEIRALLQRQLDAATERMREGFPN